MYLCLVRLFKMAKCFFVSFIRETAAVAPDFMRVKNVMSDDVVTRSWIKVNCIVQKIWLLEVNDDEDDGKLEMGNEARRISIILSHTAYMHFLWPPKLLN